MAGSVFASLAKETTAARRMEWTERIVREGLPYSTSAAYNGTLTVGGAWASSFAFPGITRAFWCESATISSNKNAVIQLGLSASSLGAGYSDVADVVVGPGAAVILPIRQLFRPSQYAGTGALGGGTVRNLIDADNTSGFVRMTLFGHSLTDDLNYSADKALLWIGDSITAGGTGPTVKTNQYDWRILNYLKSQGKNVRMVNMSMSGTTTGNAERRRSHGDYDLPQVDHICYSMGANDAPGGNTTTVAASKANIAAAIAWKKSRHPAATMTVFGITPQENTANETVAALLRTAASDAVTEAADSKVKFCNLGSAFDRTVAGNYASSDPAGTRIHPSDAGHAAIWTVVQPFLDANPILT